MIETPNPECSGLSRPVCSCFRPSARPSLQSLSVHIISDLTGERRGCKLQTHRTGLLVLDEADQLLAPHFRSELLRILEHVGVCPVQLLLRIAPHDCRMLMSLKQVLR